MSTESIFRPAHSDVRFPGRGCKDDIAALLRALPNLPDALMRQGFESLRKGQDEICNAVLKLRDTIGVLPTGQGKSACYVTPTLCHGFRSLIFSPLTALMADQVNKLVRLGLRAGAVSSLSNDGINHATLEAWRSGELQFLFVAPERIPNKHFTEVVAQMPPDMVVIDEAHVVANWSDNFRPEYKMIGDLIRVLNPKVVLALTATCPQLVEDEIRSVFCLKDAVRLTYYPRRKNLVLNTNVSNADDAEVFQYIINSATTKGQTMVYCGSIKNVEKVTSVLQSLTQLQVDQFHGQLPDAAKRAGMDAFMSGDASIIVCTNAFGMGIDKPDVRAVVHYDIPGSIESLAQEIGRAGRDGNESICMTFLRDTSVNLQRFFILNGYAHRADTRRVYEYLKGQCHTSEDGVFFSTQADIGTAARVNGVEASIQLLYSRALITKEVSADRATVQVKAADASPQFQAFINALTRCSIFRDAKYSFKLPELAKTWATTDATARNRIKDFAKRELIEYTPAARGTKFSIVAGGDIDGIDFTQIEQNEADAYEKLRRVQEYCHLRSSDDRHAFIEAEFGIKK